MKLSEILSQHPEAADEIAAMISEHTNAAKADASARVDRALPILQSSDYPAAVKAAAADVIRGEKSIEALEQFVAAFDAIKAEQEQIAAIEDTKAEPQTPAVVTTSASVDGQIRNETDLEEAAAAVRRERKGV